MGSTDERAPALSGGTGSIPGAKAPAAQTSGGAVAGGRSAAGGSSSSVESPVGIQGGAKSVNACRASAGVWGGAIAAPERQLPMQWQVSWWWPVAGVPWPA